MFANLKRLKARRMGPLLSACLVWGVCSSSWAQSPERAPDSPGSANRDTGSGVEEVILEIGQQHVLSANGVRSYSEGTRGIVDVRLTRKGDQFVLVGLQSGVTTLLLMMLDGSERHLRITVPDPEGKKRATGELSVEKMENIRLDFYFVQLDRATQRQIGMGYPGSVDLGSASASFDFLTQSFQSATAVVEDQALLRLDMAQTSGWAKLMRKAAVIAENGQRAEFSGGGEVNIPVQGSLTTGIHTISFGSTIEILPRYDAVTGRLEIELVADVSDLTDDRGSGAPGRVTSSIATVVNLKVGQALVLAGLTSETKLKSNTGLPFLSQVPILGLLFGSERMVEQNADNVIFIVPTVVDATSTDARRQVKAALDAFRSYRGKSKELEIIRSTWGSK